MMLSESRLSMWGLRGILYFFSSSLYRVNNTEYLLLELLAHLPGPLFRHGEGLGAAGEVAGVDDEAGQQAAVALVFHEVVGVTGDFGQGLFELLQNGEVLFHVGGHNAGYHDLPDHDESLFGHVFEYVAVLLEDDLEGLVDMVLFQDTLIVVLDG